MANRSEQAISVTDNLHLKDKRTKFARSLGRAIFLLLSALGNQLKRKEQVSG